MIIRILVISLFFYSCSMKDEVNQNNEMKVNLSTSQKYNYNDEIFEVSINYEISNNHFVFVKDDSTFRANVLTTIQVYSTDNDSIIIQDSWKNEVIEEYYENTRSSTTYLSFTKRINLSGGEYNIRVNMQDLDNSNIFKSQKKIDLSTLNGFGELAIYSLDRDSNESVLAKEINNELKIDNNNIQLFFQYFHDSQNIEELVLKLDDPDEEYTEKYFDLLMDENGFYSIEFKIPDKYYNEVELTLSVSDYSIKKTLYIENPDNDFWTNDIDEIIAVMRYILPISDIKALKKMEMDQKLEFISNFWWSKDPTPDTEKNELLIEFTGRVKFANLKFSDLNKGWRSDRGRIWIIYGPPDMVEKYSTQTDGIYEIWEYPSGVKFTFLDRNGFGNFILIRQTL